MNRTPYVPRPRCYLCKGRRVIVAAEITDMIVLVPCPSCSHRGPPMSGLHVSHLPGDADVIARAA